MNGVVLLDVVYVVLSEILDFESVWMNTGMILINLLLCCHCVQSGKGRNGMFLFLCLTSVILLFLIIIVNHSAMRKLMECFTDHYYVLENRIRYGKDTNLYASAGKAGEKETLRLKVEIDKSAQLYLKGFCGTIYENGRWREEKPYEMEYEGLLSYLKSERFYPDDRLCRIAEESDYYEKLHKVEVKVENCNASRKYWYIPALLPYEENASILRNEGAANTRTIPGIFGRTSYSYTAYAAEDMKALTEMLLSYQMSDVTKEEKVYRAYVYETCLLLPQDFEKELEGVRLQNIGGRSGMEVVKSVELETKKTADPFERVSDAVLLLRYAGMPARYAEGYYVNTSENYENVMVTEACRIPWAEVYLDGIGFVPVLFGVWNDEEKVSWFIEEQESAVSDENGIFVKPNSKEGYLPMYVLSCLCAGITTEMLVLLYFKIRKRKRKSPETVYAEYQENFPVFLCKAMKNMLEYYNIEVDFKYPYQSASEVEEKLGTDMRIRFERVLFLSDKARFGKTGKGNKGNEKYD